MNDVALLSLELDKLKSVYRKSYITDGSRNENSAEHSWHLAVALMGYSILIPDDVDINKCIQMALCHDICEIGAGDVCAYHDTSDKHEKESKYLDELCSKFPTFGSTTKTLWEEYEAGVTAESHWVKVFDKLLPFLLNIASEGRTWKEQNITKSMVLKHNASIGNVAPELLEWMHVEIDKAVNARWLDPA